MSVRAVRFKDGLAIHGAFPDQDVLDHITSFAGGPLPLVLADPPYGNITSEKWDKVLTSDVEYAEHMLGWTKLLGSMVHPGGALYTWGGIGKPRDEDSPAFRPFYRYLLEVELKTEWRLSSHITWKKKRAYGIQWGYLFTREELAYFVLGDVKKPRCFHVPLLEKKRGYEGYDKDHPAKSEFLRRTNVWDDVTEILRGKTHETQKPRRLMEVPIEIHTTPGEVVLDPFAGSGTTAHAARALGRRFVVVEKDPVEFEKMVASLRGEAP